MFTKYLLLLLCYVCGVLSINSFIDKGNRAQLFELTDDTIPSFQIKVPEEEFSYLQEKVEYNYIYKSTLGSSKVNIEMFLIALKGVNFNETYPGYNANELLPELKIDRKGYSQIDHKKILEGCDFKFEHYNINDPTFFFKILESNKNFDLIKLIDTLSKLEMAPKAHVEVIYSYILLWYKNTIKKTLNILKREEDESAEFKIKNATLIVDLDSQKKTLKSVTFKLAGNNSRLFSKPAFNLKIHDEDLYGRSQFKLRADGSEPTFLRTKLVSDIHNRLGLPSISTNYIKLFINNYYMGLYLISDTYKPSWVKQYYGEKNTPNLYQCEYLFDFNPAYAASCFNENKDVQENNELKQFLEKVNNAKSVADVESIFEVDHFLTEMAIDYLLGSWDHIQNPTTGHNFYLYKQKSNGKWIYLSYDFDLDFGMPSEKSINMSFDKYIKKPINLVDLLIFKDPTRFEKILKDVVAKVFNPGTLYPHIDELKKFIKPLVKYDKTPDAQGNYPGRLNTLAKDYYSMEVWDANSEFTRVKTKYTYTYGLKYWVLYRYRFVCNYYKMNCDSEYLNENYQYYVDKNVEYRDPVNPNTTRNNNNSVYSSSAIKQTIQCWSELMNYECCPPNITKVLYRDEYGDWSYDQTKKRWCGLTRYKEPTPDKVCWSKQLGYACCKGCKVQYKNKSGLWGYELNHWCGIPSYCKK